jgi:hypothetical protein
VQLRAGSVAGESARKTDCSARDHSLADSIRSYEPAPWPGAGGLRGAFFVRDIPEALLAEDQAE